MFQTNEYFDGKVKSLAFETRNLPATVGVMAPGDYVFTTGKKETMTVVSGSMTVTLPGETSPRTLHAGESFEVAANASFDVHVTVNTAYLCLYG